MNFEEYLTEAASTSNLHSQYVHHQQRALHHADQADAAKKAGDHAAEAHHIAKYKEHAKHHFDAVIAHASSMASSKAKDHHEEESYSSGAVAQNSVANHNHRARNMLNDNHLAAYDHAITRKRRGKVAADADASHAKSTMYSDKK